MQVLLSWFFMVALLALMISGVLMIISPTLGQRVLKNVAVAIGILILSVYLLNALAGLMQILLRGLAHVALLVSLMLPVGASFIYMFRQKQGFELLKRTHVISGALIAVGAVAWLVSRSGDALALLALLTLSFVAYRVREHRMRRRPTPKKLGRAERKPVLPRVVKEPAEGKQDADEQEDKGEL